MVLSMGVDGSYVSSMSEFDAEEKDSGKPNERLHAVVWRRRGMEGGEGRRNRRRQTGSTTGVGFCRKLPYVTHCGEPGYVITHIWNPQENEKTSKTSWPPENHRSRIQDRESIFVHTRKEHREQIMRQKEKKKESASLSGWVVRVS